MIRTGKRISDISRAARAIDRRLTHRWTKPQPGPVDRLLVRLSRAADHSVLWLGLAAAGGLFGGSRGRRAAGHGVFALAFTSAIVNGPLKLAVGRRRPTPRRRLRHMPRTSSFPSGHAASAFAVASVIDDQSERFSVDFLAYSLATLAAMSRVHDNEHWMSDVFIGSALGYFIGKKISALNRPLSSDNVKLSFQFSTGLQAFTVRISF